MTEPIDPERPWIISSVVRYAPVPTPTTREVEKCVQCPFCLDNATCGAPDDGMTLTDAEYWGDVPPPAACPLRVAPVLVVLRVKS